jgi:hypothetical protein
MPKPENKKMRVDRGKISRGIKNMDDTTLDDFIEAFRKNKREPDQIKNSSKTNTPLNRLDSGPGSTPGPENPDDVYVREYGLPAPTGIKNWFTIARTRTGDIFSIPAETAEEKEGALSLRPFADNQNVLLQLRIHQEQADGNYEEQDAMLTGQQNGECTLKIGEMVAIQAQSRTELVLILGIHLSVLRDSFFNKIRRTKQVEKILDAIAINEAKIDPALQHYNQIQQFIKDAKKFVETIALQSKYHFEQRMEQGTATRIEWLAELMHKDRADELDRKELEEYCTELAERTPENATLILAAYLEWAKGWKHEEDLKKESQTILKTLSQNPDWAIHTITCIIEHVEWLQEEEKRREQVDFHEAFSMMPDRDFNFSYDFRAANANSAETLAALLGKGTLKEQAYQMAKISVLIFSQQCEDIALGGQYIYRRHEVLNQLKKLKDVERSVFDM